MHYIQPHQFTLMQNMQRIKYGLLKRMTSSREFDNEIMVANF